MDHLCVNRISEAGYKLQRVPEDIGIYDAMEHGEDKHNKANSMKYGYFILSMDIFIFLNKQDQIIQK